MAIRGRSGEERSYEAIVSRERHTVSTERHTASTPARVDGDVAAAFFHRDPPSR